MTFFISQEVSILSYAKSVENLKFSIESIQSKQLEAIPDMS